MEHIVTSPVMLVIQTTIRTISIISVGKEDWSPLENMSKRPETVLPSFCMDQALFSMLAY